MKLRAGLVLCLIAPVWGCSGAHYAGTAIPPEARITDDRILGLFEVRAEREGVQVLVEHDLDEDYVVTFLEVVPGVQESMRLRLGRIGPHTVLEVVADSSMGTRSAGMASLMVIEFPDTGLVVRPLNGDALAEEVTGGPRGINFERVGGDLLLLESTAALHRLYSSFFTRPDALEGTREPVAFTRVPEGATP